MNALQPRRTALAAIAGALFGLGLCVSGMTRPSKVLGFLDVAGDWDLSLAFVMGGAVLVHSVLFAVIRRRGKPLWDASFHFPTRRDIDWKLVVGAGLFGVGWGISGFCPGPALVATASLATPVLVFVGCMVIGMLLYSQWARRVSP